MTLQEEGAKSGRAKLDVTAFYPSLSFSFYSLALRDWNFSHGNRDHLFVWCRLILTSEKTHLEFRGEFFSLTNHPNFSDTNISTDFTNPSQFGKIHSIRDNPNDPRQIQFALKFYW